MASSRHSGLERLFARWNRDLSAYLTRRPHRSFRRTLRRDYVRSFALPGYMGLTRDTALLIGRNWKLFGSFFIVYSIVSAIILGVVNQTNYSTISNALKSADPDVWVRSLAIFGTAITGGLNPASTANGQILGSLLVVLAWLIMVWLLRHRSNGTAVTLREGMYGAGAPLVSTTLVTAVGLLQCLPLVVVAIGYSAALSTGLLNQGIEAMLFYGAAALLTLLSLYWLTSTFIALIVVTLPGMYPMAALRAAGDLVVGRRLRLILRLLWLTLVVLVLWAVILLPIILLDNWLNIGWLPLVPVCVLALGTGTLIVVSTYIYVLYRKLVDDEAKPA